MKSNYITIWSEDFTSDVWEDYCDAANVPYEVDHIRIYFNDEDVGTY